MPLVPIAYPVTFTLPAGCPILRAFCEGWDVNRTVPGLGRHFRTAVGDVVQRLTANPQQFPIVHKNVRRALLRRFPYALMFVIEADTTLTVIACFHGSRDPARWQKRS